MKSGRDIKKRVNYAKKRILPTLLPLVMSDFGKKQELVYKDDNTLPTDIRADEACIDKILRKYPYDSVLTEERDKVSGNIKGNNYEWIVDSIDGSMNFKEVRPYFATSIAIKKDDDLHAGMVYHYPSRSLYFGQASKGAYLNNQKIHVSDKKELGKANVSLVADISYEKHGIRDLMERLKNRIGNEQQLKCTSLEFAYVASGVFDGIVKPTRNPWGVSAGMVLIPEAGGKLTTYNKGDLNIHVASNPFIHDALCKVVEKYLEKNK